MSPLVPLVVKVYDGDYPLPGTVVMVENPDDWHWLSGGFGVMFPEEVTTA